MQRPASSRLVSNETLILAAILALGAALRLMHIDQPLIDAFSVRESSTAQMARNLRFDGWHILYPAVDWVGAGPGYQGREFQLYTFLCALLAVPFGWHDWIGRTVSVVFGLVSILALHRIVARLWGRQRADLAALSLAIMPGAILIQRGYLPGPVMLALVLGGLWAFIAYVQRPRVSLLALATVLTTLGILTKPPGIIVLAPMVYLAATLLPRTTGLTRTRGAQLAGALAVCLVALVAYFSWAIYLGTTTPPYHVSGGGYLWQHPRSYLEQGLFLSWTFHQTRTWLLGAPFLVLACVGLVVETFKARRETDPARAPWLFHIWLLAGLAFYIPACGELPANPWNYLVYLPPAAFFATAGIERIARVRHLAGAKPIVLTLLIGTLLVADYPILKTGMAASDPTGRAMGLRLRALSAPGDLVIAVDRKLVSSLPIYYSGRRGWLFPPGGKLPPGGPLAGTNWESLEPDAKALWRFGILRADGARWFAYDKSATDTKGRRLTVYNRGLIAYLDKTYRKAADTKDYVIYDLKTREAGAGGPLHGEER